MSGNYRFSQLAREQEVTTRTVRFDEEQGLLPTERHANGLSTRSGIDLERLITAGQRICAVLDKPKGSRVARTLGRH
ncbi:MAG: MerR family DNA-binding transcriptional regulator [Pseudomonas aeruginosa]